MKKLLLSTAVVAILAFSGTAQAVNDSALATATVVDILEITSITPMSFGSFTTASASGKITTDSSDTTGVYFAPTGETPSDMTVSIKGEAGLLYNTTGSDTNVTLAHKTDTAAPSLSATLGYSGLSSPLALNSSTGLDTLTVVGTMSLPTTLVTGDYEGTIQVTVAYN